jgi:hypothetical protein
MGETVNLANGERELSRRIAAEYREMPGLCLTVRQAARLLQVDGTACQHALESLALKGYLRHVGEYYVRAGSGASVPEQW